MHKKGRLFLLILMLICLPVQALALKDGFNAGLDLNSGPQRVIQVQPDGDILTAGAYRGDLDGGIYRFLHRLHPDGSRDTGFNPTFDSMGPTGGIGIRTLALQPDGRIIVAGEFTKVNGTPRNGLARLNPDGSVDTSFNANSALPLMGQWDWWFGGIKTVVVQQDGKILIGGKFNDNNGPRNIMRLNADGTEDSTFRLGVNAEVSVILLQKDGNILVAGGFTGIGTSTDYDPDTDQYQGGTAVNCLIRLLNGNPVVLDPLFTPPQLAWTDDVPTIKSAALMVDGRIVIGGSFDSADNDPSVAYLAMLGRDGRVQPGAASGDGQVNTITLRPDGSMILTGYFTQIGGIPRNSVAGLDRLGNVDSFACPQAEHPRNMVDAVALQSDGNILVSGQFQTYTPRKLLIRLYPGGAVDDDVVSGADDQVFTLSLQPDGTLAVGGALYWLVNGSAANTYFLKLHPDWTPDPYGRTLDLHAVVMHVHPMPNNKFLVGGAFKTIEGIPQKALALIDSSGHVDPSFRPTLGGNSLAADHGTWVLTTTVQPDGNIIVSGTFDTVNGSHHLNIVRLHPDGTTDDTFQQQGIDYIILAVALQPDGKILVAGDNGITRLNGADGSTDPTFHPPTVDGWVTDVLLQPDGKILMCGLFTHLGNVPAVQIARLNSDGTIDTTFIPPVPDQRKIRNMSLQANGSIVISGDFQTLDGQPKPWMARLLANGTLDGSFDVGSWGEQSTTNVVIQQPDGKVVVGGWFRTNYPAPVHYLARIYGGLATQELKVSAGDSEVSWLRGGTSPELWRVTFEDSGDGVNWTPLGTGTRITGGWTLGRLHLAHGQTRWLRARGWATTGDFSSTANVLESVRQYYLELLPQSISVTIPDKVYGDGDFTPNGTATSGLTVRYLSLTPGVVTVVDGKIHITGAGTATVVAVQPGSDLYASAPEVPVTFQVAPAPLTVTANPASRIYGGTDPAFSATYTGFVYQDTAASLSGVPGFSTTATATTAPGSYPLTVANGTLASSNYTFTFVGGTLTVTKAPLTISADNRSSVYGSPLPTLTASFNGFVNQEGPTVLGGSISLATSATASSPAGSYNITVARGTLSSNNYSFIFSGARLHIAKATLTVRADDKSRSYGAANPQLTATVTGFANGETASVLTGAAAITTSATTSTPTGSYPITIAQGSLASNNYTFTFVPGTLNITRATLTVSADNLSRAYGEISPMLTTTTTGFVNGDTAAAVTGAPSLSTAATTSSPAGSYPITVSRGSLASPNYSFTFTPGTLSVTKATLTVSADSASRSYGAPPPALTATITGYVNGDSASVLTGAPTLATTATTASPTGNYPITVSQGTLGSDRYQFTFLPGTLTVNRAALTVSADSTSRPYGASNPPLTATITGYVNGESFSALTGAPTLATTATASSPAGSYAITVARGSLASPNYSFTFNQGSLTVTKAPLSITADDKGKKPGDANPPLTASFTGFVNGDTPASLGGTPYLTTAASERSPVGNYPILVELGTISSPNYSYSFINGTLAVTNSDQVINFPPMRAKTYGDGNFDPGATATSGLPVTYRSSDPTVAEVVNGKIRVVTPGSAEITASQGGNADFGAAADVTRTLLVNPPPWNALAFDGTNDLVQIPNAPQLNFGQSTSFSIEAWLHLDGPQQDRTGLISKGLAGASGYQLLLFQDRIAAEIGDGAVTVGAEQGLVGTTDLNDGQWHHVGLTVDRAASQAKLYLDGRLETLLPIPSLTGSLDNGADLRIGVDRSGTLFFQGEMDELRVWGSVRTRDDIRSQSSQIMDPAQFGELAAYFHFDEGDAGLGNAGFATLPERTANGDNGNLRGFALNGSQSNWVRSGAFLPLLETAPPSLLSASGAWSGGEVYPNYYPPTDRGLCWGTAPGPDLSGSCSHVGSGVGSFTSGMTGLSPGTTYHIRGFATNIMGTAYGNEITFTTSKLEQTISFETLPTKTYGDSDFPPAATTSSGLPVTYTSSNTGVAIVVGDQIHITGAGTSIITAAQGGNNSYSSASDVSQPFTVLKATLQVVADDKTRAYRAANPELTASYSGFVKGETPSVLSGAPSLATAADEASLVGSYDIVTGVGTLVAANYSFACVKGTLTVIKSCQEISFPPIGERTFGDPPFKIIASACSGLTLVFATSDPAVAQISGNILTITGAGSVSVTASQAGNDNVSRAPDVSQLVVVHKGGQGITFSSLAQKVLGDPPFTLSATSSSGLPVTYRSSDNDVAAVSGNTVTIVGVGTAVITAHQTGNNNYEEALPISQPLTVAPERTPPALALSTLSSGAATANPVLNLEGLASDASGIALLTVNGSDLTPQASLFSTAVPLAGGDNSITVIAQDGAGNRTTESRNITLDAAAPAITMSAPADNSVTETPHVEVKGTVPPGSEVTFSVNGSPPAAVPVTDGNFTGSGDLVQGVNTIEVSASNGGRIATVKRSIALTIEHPPIAITSPGEDIRTEQKEMVVAGSAGGDRTGILVQIDVNGASFTPSVAAGQFQQQISLDQAGMYRIRAKVTDAEGFQSVTQRNIIRVERILGDLNGDGRVDIADAVAALRISLGLDPAGERDLSHGDVAPLVNGVPQPDGVMDVGDVVVILRKIVGLVDF